MAESQIRYARTSDGVSIAYFVMGSGPTLIAISAGLHQSIEFNTKTSNFRAAAEASARAFTYVRYDPRGSGLSDRDIDDFSIDAMARDLEAVADAISADQFMLFAPGGLGLCGVAFAARHPDRVSRLVLWATAARGDAFDIAALRPIRATAESDWRLASEALIQAVDHWDNPDVARENAAVMRASVEPGTYMRYDHALHDWDVTALLPDVTCPTLVIHPASNEYFPVARARQVAATIPGARLVLVDSASVLMPNSEVVRTAGLFFLNRESHRRVEPVVPARGTAIILFLDIVDSTALTERMGDEKFRQRARTLDTRLRTVIREHGGKAIDGKLLGDGVMATFASASEAIASALACTSASGDLELELHVGLHAGDVIREENNVFGGAVNIASRISGLSAPGEVLVSDIVRGLARTSAGVAFDDRGEYALKGIADPVRVFAVRSADSRA